MYCFERAYFFLVSIKTKEKYSEILLVITISIFMLSMLGYKSKLAKKKSTLSENLPRKKNSSQSSKCGINFFRKNRIDGITNKNTKLNKIIRDYFWAE
jgi:hypothetical protein